MISQKHIWVISIWVEIIVKSIIKFETREQVSSKQKIQDAFFYGHGRYPFLSFWLYHDLLEQKDDFTGFLRQ